MDENPDRDHLGRFKNGHGVKSPGNPNLRRLGEAQRAIRAALTPEQIVAVMRKLAHKALAEGDVQAAKAVLERVAGRPSQEPEPEIGIELPPLKTMQDCALALDHVLSQLTAGNVDREGARLLIEAIENRRRLIESVEFDERLRKLEDSAGGGKW